MNKTVTINISGIIFHIEEGAYEHLNKYLNTIRGYFSTSEGRDEIMGDIESRIAELLQEKISASKQVVTMADVEYVTGIMGKPEDFAGEGNQENQEEKNHSEETKHERVKRRLFRDTDSKILGGVCSGVSNYFDLDVVWVRIILVALTFLGFSGVFVYIILWIVVPAARTTAEKLQMHGESVDINNISKSVKEEAESVKKKMKDFGKDAKVRGRETGDRIGDFFYDFFHMAGKILGRVIGLFLVCFAIFFLVIFVMGSLGLSIAGGVPTIKEGMNGLFEAGSDKILLYFGLFLLFGIPIVMMLYKGIKMLFKIKFHNRWINMSAGVFWFVGLAICTYVAIKTVKSFDDYAETELTEFISQAKSDTLYLGMDMSNKYNSPDFVSSGQNKTSYISVDNGEVKILNEGDKKIFIGMPGLKIIRSQIDSIEITVVNSSHGASQSDAKDRAAQIRYKYGVKDSAVLFNNYFFIPGDEKWKCQDVVIYIKIPNDKVIYIDENLKYFLDDVKNTTNTGDQKMVGRRWKMTQKGLECIDCKGLEDDNSSIREQIKEHKEALKELSKELKNEIEEKVKDEIKEVK